METRSTRKLSWSYGRRGTSAAIGRARSERRWLQDRREAEKERIRRTGPNTKTVTVKEARVCPTCNNIAEVPPCAAFDTCPLSCGEASAIGAWPELGPHEVNQAPEMDYCRGYAVTTSVMPGLWLDLDIAGGGHEKKGLPQNQVDCDRILSELPFDPSWVVGTGGGTHVYWLFREPWILESNEERDRAAAMIRGWQTWASPSTRPTT